MVDALTIRQHLKAMEAHGEQYSSFVREHAVAALKALDNAKWTTASWETHTTRLVPDPETPDA